MYFAAVPTTPTQKDLVTELYKVITQLYNANDAATPVPYRRNSHPRSLFFHYRLARFIVFYFPPDLICQSLVPFSSFQTYFHNTVSVSLFVLASSCPLPLPVSPVTHM